MLSNLKDSSVQIVFLFFFAENFNYGALTQKKNVQSDVRKIEKADEIRIRNERKMR